MIFSAADENVRAQNPIDTEALPEFTNLLGKKEIILQVVDVFLFVCFGVVCCVVLTRKFGIFSLLSPGLQYEVDKVFSTFRAYTYTIVC
jgi:hypothetical protein